MNKRLSHISKNSSRFVGKSLKDGPAQNGSAVIKESIKKTKKNEDVDEVIVGQVLTGGTTKSCKTSCS